MNRRSFFGMFGKLSAVTAAGILLPEPIKTYFFVQQNRIAIRAVRVYDAIQGKLVNRLDIAYADFFPLEIPDYAEMAYRVEFPNASQKDAIEYFSKTWNSHHPNAKAALNALSLKELKSPECLSVSWKQ